MKKIVKIVICLLSLLIILALCSCSQKEKWLRTYTETQGGLQITYTYNNYYNMIISKNIYDANTGITIEYLYFYENKGWGAQLIGVSVITVDKDGQIIDKYDSGN